jgi:Ca2+-binding EF-hand superfamily protein
MTSQKIQKLFGRIDINKDGFITPNDLQHFTNKELSLD